MPRVEIPITDLDETGTSPPSTVAGDATNDHYLEGGSDCILECTNSSGGALDVTIVTSYETVGGIGLADNVITVAAGATKIAKLKGPQVRAYYKQSTDLDRIHVNVTSNSWAFRAYAIT